MARMNSAAVAAITAVLLTSTIASAQTQNPQAGPAVQALSSIPADSVTVTHWYKQNVVVGRWRETITVWAIDQGTVALTPVS